MSETRTVRCLLGMLGTDVHSKGIRTLAQILRDAGIEVIYIGEHNSVEGMASAVVDEDADIVGVSFSSAAYVEYTRQLVEAMQRKRSEEHTSELKSIMRISYAVFCLQK